MASDDTYTDHLGRRYRVVPGRPVTGDRVLTRIGRIGILSNRYGMDATVFFDDTGQCGVFTASELDRLGLVYDAPTPEELDCNMTNPFSPGSPHADLVQQKAPEAAQAAVVAPVVAPATKHDGGKPRMDLISSYALKALGDVLAFGAGKYGDRNWEQGLPYGRIYAAALRHLTSWFDGEERDPETGKPHTWHALCCLMMIVETERRVDAEMLPSSLDDRPRVRVGAPS